jgi:hypothetical protein
MSSEFRNLGSSELPLKPVSTPADIAGGTFRHMRTETERVIIRSIGEDPFTRSPARFRKFAVDRTVPLLGEREDIPRVWEGRDPMSAFIASIPSQTVRCIRTD